LLIAVGAATAISYSGSPSQDSASKNPSTSHNGSTHGKPPGSSSNHNPPDVAAISAELDPSVVDITATLALGAGEAAGTGMVITPSGEVLTNNHVIDEATSITAQIEGRGTKYTATVIGTDPTEDVALLQLKGASGLKTVSFGDSSSVSVGEPVVAIGNALDLPGLPTVTSGTITAVGRPIIAQDAGTALCENLSGMLQTDAKLEPGNSGGPLVTSSGQVIGMNTAATSSGQSAGVGTAGSRIGFAIPISRAVQIITAMRNNDPTSTIHIGPSPLLGVEVIRVNGAGSGSACKSHGSGGASGFRLGETAPVKSGALVVNVEGGTPADAAGIQEGDAITSFDNQPVKTPLDLTKLVQAMKPNDRVEVGWVDISGTSHVAHVFLATGPAD
jgi:S1-C subfamily serine protease